MSILNGKDPKNESDNNKIVSLNTFKQYRKQQKHKLKDPKKQNKNLDPNSPSKFWQIMQTVVFLALVVYMLHLCNR